MESPVNWEYKTLINELTHGMEKAKQLRFHLCTMSENQVQDLLMQRILSSYEKALLILKWTGSKQQDQVVTTAATSVALESSVSVDGSPRSEGLNKNFGDHQDYMKPSKKRKMQPTWTEQVKVNSESGLEGPTDDGFSWRKYGQKDILGAKYPRSYYRCTYRLVQDCWATKQVQRSDDDPTIFDITYRGTHTCNHSTIAVPPPASPDKQETKRDISDYHHQPQQLNQTLSSLKSNLRVNTEDLNNDEVSPHFSFPSTFASYDSENCYFPFPNLVDGTHQGTYSVTYSPLFLSPAASESNYFTTGTYNPMNSNWGGANLQHPEIDIVSAHASTANSPIGGVEFSIDPVGLEPHFPFNPTEFFTNSNFEC
ncbi:putative WRKY transcription factor 53-like [Dorcoceras hygrometricum]|uniref:Putative WRKY transcription factor 53-like n=1 Tax=Dorcoceras hygrometricum TaxID=472368 RepID=A0A2Z7BBR5_9LAMI|nr:putative WRKY transcription factor 53-like [Dorcoceras hygrometricum]